MSLVRWRPAHGPGPFSSGALDMFDNFFRGDLWDKEAASWAWSPAVDVTEGENEYVVKVDLPGVTKDDVKITINGNVLTIKGEKRQEKESKESDYHMVERSYGTFQRSFTLPGSVSNDKIEAAYKDGVLKVVLPKEEEAKTRTVEVRVK